MAGGIVAEQTPAPDIPAQLLEAFVAGLFEDGTFAAPVLGRGGSEAGAEGVAGRAGAHGRGGTVSGFTPTLLCSGQMCAVLAAFPFHGL